MKKSIDKIFSFSLIFLVLFLLLNNLKLLHVTSYARNSSISVQIKDDGTISDGLKFEKGEKKVSLLNNFLSSYRDIIVFLSGIALFSMILFFILNFIALSNSKGNPQDRKKAINGIIITGIATAGLGSVTLISTLFYNMIKDKSV